MVEISQNIVAFSEYMNFKEKCTVLKVKPSRQNFSLFKTLFQMWNSYSLFK